MEEQLEFLRLIAARLQAAGIPYMVTGSLALAVWAVPRMTRDIDVVVEVGPADAQRLVRLFADDCVVDEDAVREAIARRGMFNVIHAEWIVKADFIVRKDAAYRKVELDRRRWLEVAGTAIAFVSPEDSHSELQRRDVRQLVESVEDLDWGYLHTWAGELGVRDALERIGGRERHAARRRRAVPAHTPAPVRRGRARRQAQRASHPRDRGVAAAVRAGARPSCRAASDSRVRDSGSQSCGIVVLGAATGRVRRLRRSPCRPGACLRRAVSRSAQRASMKSLKRARSSATTWFTAAST